MINRKRDLLNWLKKIDNKLDQPLILIAVGGTAITLLNLKESTRDIDFCVEGKDYERLTIHNIFPVNIGKRISQKELMRRTLIFGLKTSGINKKDSGLDRMLFEERFGISPDLVFGTELNRLKELELIEDDENFIKLTLKGLVLSEEVCRELYSKEIKDQLEKLGDKFGRAGL